MTLVSASLLRLHSCRTALPQKLLSLSPSLLRIHLSCLSASRLVSHSMSSATSSVKGQWKRVDAKGDVPQGRSSTAAGVIGNSLYVFSGEHTPRVPIDNDMHRLDLSSSTWSKIPAAAGWPAARVGHAGTVTGNKLYVYGGRIGKEFADKTLADLAVFDPADSSFTSVAVAASSPAPPPLSYHSLTSSPTHLFLFGGCTVDHGRSSSLWSFELLSGLWEQLSGGDSLGGPAACGGSSAVYVDGSVHALFGYDGKLELNQHFAFNLSQQAWQQLQTVGSSHPAARSVTDVVHLPAIGSLYVMGGEFTPSVNGHEGAGEYHADAHLFDIQRSVWSAVDCGDGEQPSARGWFNSCAGSDGKSVVIFGGFDGKERLNDVWIWKADV